MDTDRAVVGTGPGASGAAFRLLPESGSAASASA